MVVVPDSAVSEGNGDDADRRDAIKALGVGGFGTALFPHAAVERIAAHASSWWVAAVAALAITPNMDE